jgi:hypothetical protein
VIGLEAELTAKLGPLARFEVTLLQAPAAEQSSQPSQEATPEPEQPEQPAPAAPAPAPEPTPKLKPWAAHYTPTPQPAGDDFDLWACLAKIAAFNGRPEFLAPEKSRAAVRKATNGVWKQDPAAFPHRRVHVGETTQRW